MTRIATAIRTAEISDGQGIGTGSARIRVWALSQPPSAKGTEARTSNSSSNEGTPVPVLTVIVVVPHARTTARVVAVDDDEPRRLAERSREEPLELEDGEIDLADPAAIGHRALFADPVADAGVGGGLCQRLPRVRFGAGEDAHDRGHALEETSAVRRAHGLLAIAGEDDEAQRLRDDERGEEEGDQLAGEAELGELHAVSSAATSAAST